MKKPKLKTKTLKLKSCYECPHLKNDRTPGSGYALDFFCTASPIPGPKSCDWREPRTYNPHGFRIVDNYIEWDRDKREEGDFPEWCPL